MSFHEPSFRSKITQSLKPHWNVENICSKKPQFWINGLRSLQERFSIYHFRIVLKFIKLPLFSTPSGIQSYIISPKDLSENSRDVTGLLYDSVNIFVFRTILDCSFISKLDSLLQLRMLFTLDVELGSGNQNVLLARESDE